jgi:hypothetical protein
MHVSLRPILALAALGAAANGALAQGMPTSQPNILTIYIEELKIGRYDDHAANEAGWPAAFAKANSPDYYLALASMTGVSEIWFVQPFESFSREGESLQRNQSDPVLAAELARLSRADAEYLNGYRTLQAVARTDLSFGAFPDLAKARFWDITTFRVRPGHEQGFEAAAKAYAAAAKRLAPSVSFRTYEITAGMPGPTFLVFSSVNSYAEFDQMMATGNAIMQGITAQERALFQKFSAEDLMSALTNRYRLDPRMSYVAAETKAADPAFWDPKR